MTDDEQQAAEGESWAAWATTGQDRNASGAHAHGWFAGYTAALAQNGPSDGALRKALEQIASQAIPHVVGEHQLPDGIALRMRTIAMEALAAESQEAGAER